MTEPTPEGRAREIAVKVYALMPEDEGNAASGLIAAAIREAEDRGRREERERCARIAESRQFVTWRKSGSALRTLIAKHIRALATDTDTEEGR